MDYPTAADEDDFVPTFYVGQHESKRTEVTPQLLRQAQDCNYDMLTAPITTPYFNLRVFNMLREYMDDLENYPSRSPSIPTIPALSALDTNLAPGDIIPQLLGVVSPWIDLCSPDPVVYNISRQVLEMEVAYAAFCGMGNLILPTPRLHHGTLHGEGIAQYAYATQEALNIGNYIQLSISMPMMDNPQENREEMDSSLAKEARRRYMGLAEDSARVYLSPKHDFFGSWDAWNIIRTVCKYSARLFVALQVPRYLPPSSVCSRWHSEPLRLLTLDTRSFFANPHGHPVLHKLQQSLLSKYMRIRNPPWILLTDVGPIPGLENPEVRMSAADGFITQAAAADVPVSPTGTEASDLHRSGSKKITHTDPLQFLQIIRHYQRKQPPRTILERFGAGYQDYLQAPLQPLTDNLESITYEVFEKDPIKYALYAQAIEKALSDWRDQGKRPSGAQGRIVVAVVGAGRGPLVTRALQASEATGVPIELWAVEKNPNAYVLLQRHNAHSWNNAVHLVKSDMRSWKGPIRDNHPPRISPYSPPNQPIPATTTYPIDILISELLGSFADNELSPECLDGILPLLNPTHGISIPQSYTAYLTPIAAPKLHADISSRGATDPQAPNTPYVVMLHAIDYLSSATTPTSTATPANRASTTTTTSTIASTSTATTTTAPSAPAEPLILPAWSFSHTPTAPLPPDAKNKHNTRAARLAFPLRDRAVCHGLAGYFEAVLYPGVELSTHPMTMDQKSRGMMSWFPIFFPLKTPLYTPDHAQLTANIWRATDNRKVWYEWVVEAWANVGGAGGEKKRVRVGVGEVGSSREKGCMM